MKLKVTYRLSKLSIGTKRVNGEFKKTYCEETKFYHEEIDIDEICKVLALKYRNENFDSDECVSVTCSID